ncbi:UbiH/UbiF/VisC/COQ6 family ubiquinone biosynthesis hydroxylase [Aquibaculum sediminis]|uniref:UbiH/UbiF/VisC/COQ6 family ubiquinone biosynthesis hydroxylase n=1 Tax=Aquibaculum sediminis TaxID=3231907 RepID=UPI0034523B33
MVTSGQSREPRAEARFDVILSGGGLVGMSLGVALADAGLQVAVIDREDPAKVVDAPFDGRASAIARGSQQVLSTIGVWQHVGPEAAPILDIRVSDGKVGRRPSRLFLHYDSADLGEGPMGYIVENRVLRRALQARAAELPGLSLLAPLTLESDRRGAERAEALLSDGRQLTAPLLVAAEGRNSPLRRRANIPVTTWDYPQAGIVCTLYHELDHAGTAHEHFLPSGPFAVLPLTDDEQGRHRSSLVWTEKRELVAGFMAMDDVAFAGELQRRFGHGLGEIAVEGHRWSYPLSLMHAARYHERRLVLIGDAAHQIHPIAGQGFNLGLRDVAALAECLVDARRLGLDLGSPSVLERYQSWRRFDTLAMLAATDGINRLFSNNLPPVRLARDLGLAAVNRLGPARRLFMRHAMGVVGDLPRLVRGEPL